MWAFQNDVLLSHIEGHSSQRGFDPMEDSSSRVDHGFFWAVTSVIRPQIITHRLLSVCAGVSTIGLIVNWCGKSLRCSLTTYVRIWVP